MRLAWNLLVLAAVTAVSLVVVDLALFAISPAPPAPFLVRGMLRADAELEHALVPGFAARFDDPLARGEIRVNARGQRDAEPTPLRDGAERWLVIGYSFAFGQRLDQHETIDAFVEKLSGGRIDAYNAGVPGYGPPNVLGALRRLDGLDASRVVYLFFANDLFAGEQEVGAETVFDGVPVKARDADGRPYTQDELRAKLESAAARSALRDALALRHLRTAVARLASHSADAPSDESVPAALATTRAMRDLARSRGQRFVVVAIPSLAELRAGAYERHSRAYLDALRAEGVEVVEPIASLEPGDYIAGDGHLASSGAEKLARAVLDSAP
jgi:hypothetical protein